MSEPDSFSAHQSHNQIKQEAAAKRSVPRAAQTECQAAAPVLPVTPSLAPEKKKKNKKKKREIHLCAAVSESLLWVRGQGRYSEGDSSVLRNWHAKPSARNLSHSVTAASQGDTQQICFSEQQHLLDKHPGTRLKTEK